MSATYTEVLNISLRALTKVVSLGCRPRMDLDDVHALAAINGQPDENLDRYLRSAVQF